MNILLLVCIYVVFPISICLSTFFFTSRRARWIVWVAMACIVICCIVTYLCSQHIEFLVESGQCSGNVLKGLSCPEQSRLTSLVLAINAFVYFALVTSPIFVFATLIIALCSESRHRSQGSQ